MSTETFKKNVKRILDLEEEEKKLKEKMDLIKREKEEMQESVIYFMEKNNITQKDIIIGKKKIKYVQMKTTENITKKLIYDKLKLFLQSDDRAMQGTEFIYNDRNSKTRTVLKICDIKM